MKYVDFGEILGEERNGIELFVVLDLFFVFCFWRERGCFVLFCFGGVFKFGSLLNFFGFKSLKFHRRESRDTELS